MISGLQADGEQTLLVQGKELKVNTLNNDTKCFEQALIASETSYRRIQYKYVTLCYTVVCLFGVLSRSDFIIISTVFLLSLLSRNDVIRAQRVQTLWYFC